MTETNASPPEAPPASPPATPQTHTPQTYAPPRDYERGYESRRDLNHRSPMLAGFLSLMPGLGNVYNGLYLRGITFFLIWGGIFALAIRSGNRASGDSQALAFLIPGIIFFYLFNLFDAYRQATLINHGYATDLGLSDSAKWSRPPGGLMLGIVILLIGVYGLLEHFFDIDLSILLDYWYFAFIAFGAWMILQARRANAEAAAGTGAFADDDDA